MNWEFRQQVTFRRTSLDVYSGKRAFQEQTHAGMGSLYRGLECDLDDLGFTIRVGCEIHHLRSRRALCQVNLTVAGDTRHVEALDIAGT